ncbi:MAG: copper amine oxidase N-terminal domain-containing protein, partial [Syntrophomonadaceae bacterium]|nr:copper amine oxidase N-terminal domain-containing protein [Syntrophomonadaceae bacterium]
KEQDILILAVGSKEAEFNQQQGIMFQAPAINNDKYMVPLRYVTEGFGEKVDWDPATYEIAVKTGLPTTAGKLLLQISEAVVQSNSYKIKAETSMDMDIVADGENQQMSMSGTVNASMSQEPLTLVMDSDMTVDALLGTDEEIPKDMLKTSAVLNEDGYFMTMPGQEGWIRLDMEGINFNQIMEQYGSQDPLQSIMQMAEFGAVITEKADKTIDGKDYGVINIVMGQDAAGKYIEDVLGQTGLLNLGVDPQENPEFETFMQEMFAGMKIDMTYDIVYDKETLLPHNMSLSSTLSMEMDIPANETAGTPAQSMQMKTEQKASYHMYDYGIAFPVPIIEDYKTMNEWLAEQIPALPDTEG